MPVIRDGKELVGGSRDGKELQYVYVGDRLAWSAGPRSPVLFDSLGGGGNRTNNGTISWTHNISGEDRYVLVAAAGCTTSTNYVADFSSVTFGGSPMSRIGQRTLGTWGRVAIFGMKNPPVGSQSVVVTCSGTSSNLIGYVANSVSYTNVADCIIHPGPAVSSGSGALSHVVPSAPLRMVISAWGGDTGFTAFAPPGSLLWGQSASSYVRLLIGAVEGTDPSVEFTTTHNGGARMAIAAELTPLR